MLTCSYLTSILFSAAYCISRCLCSGSYFRVLQHCCFYNWAEPRL